MGKPYHQEGYKIKELRENVVLKIYTSTVKYSGKDKLDITAKSHNTLGNIKGEILSPGWLLVMHYKDGLIDWERYIKKYYRILDYSWKHNKEMFLELFGMESVTLCCYCAHGTTCHKYLAADYLLEKAKECGLEALYCGEIDPKDAFDIEGELIKINQIISERISYGLRQETAKMNSWKVCWSNSDGGWYIANRVPAGTRVTLDANQILVPLAKKKIASIISRFDPLPLYYNSYEYQERNRSRN